jgi:hypothetical protein
MDWQTITTFLILATAAGVIVRRLWLFLRSGRAAQCGGCSGCGQSEKSSKSPSLVQLGTMSNKSEPDSLTPAVNRDFHSVFLGDLSATAEKNR